MEKNRRQKTKSKSHTCCYPMPPAVDLELELRRLGCVDGVLGLLRRRSINESDHVYADRIQLGAALLACKLDLRAAPTKCGATAFAAGRGGAGGDEEGSALTASWGEKALASVLDVVVQGGWCFRCPIATARQQIRPYICVVSAGMLYVHAFNVMEVCIATSGLQHVRCSPFRIIPDQASFDDR